jgi:hypothetical protein
MLHRTFTDRSGILWTVSEVTKGLPTFPRERRARARGAKRRPAAHVSVTKRDGDLPWLCFQSQRERRRLERVPEHWDKLTPIELEDLLARSVAD